MHITILTIGSRGDVQPYMALAIGLKQAGHHVCVATNAMFESFVRSYGLDFFPLAGNPYEWLTGQQSHIFTQMERNGVEYVQKATSSFIKPLVDELLEDTWQACQETDAIISMPLAIGSYHVAEKLNVPFFGVWTCPATRTHTFANPVIHSPIPLGGTFNWLSYILVEQLFWNTIQKPLNHWRQETLNLPPLTWKDHSILYKRKLPVLYSLSPTVIAKPVDWPDWVHITGYWFLDRPAGWQPPKHLIEFLNNGSPPIYITFGSLVGDDPAAITQLILQAVEMSGHRAILDIGWGGLTQVDLPATVLKINSSDAPHDWLLPQMAAAVHHAGAGTIAAVLKAGIPSVAVPAHAELFFWAQRLVDLGLGTSIPQKQLTAERLAAAMRMVSRDRSMQARATKIGQKIQAENGVAQAVELFHSYLPSMLAQC